MERSVRFTSDKLLSYDTWKKVMALPGVEVRTTSRDISTM